MARTYTYRMLFSLFICLTQVMGFASRAQEITERDSLTTDSIAQINEARLRMLEAPIDTISVVSTTDSVPTITIKEPFVPDSFRSTWLAVVFPGGGQIYNRKYWKLPIIYGGFAGCAYALNWNNNMYSDYSRAYLDIMDSDPNTKSYEEFFSDRWLSDEAWLKETLKKRKDFYRRNRDLSIFVFIGVYLLSIVDAYVDAELSDFDISRDLSLKVEPTLINDKNMGNSIGLQCSIKF